MSIDNNGVRPTATHQTEETHQMSMLILIALCGLVAAFWSNPLLLVGAP